MEEIARGGQRYPSGQTTGNYPSNVPLGRVAYPSTRYQSYAPLGGLVRVSIPNNWRQLSEGNSFGLRPKVLTARSKIRSSTRTASTSVWGKHRVGICNRRRLSFE